MPYSAATFLEAVTGFLVESDDFDEESTRPVAGPVEVPMFLSSVRPMLASTFLGVVS